MDIYILIETRDCGKEELSRHYFRNRNDALAKARAMMDETLPKRRRTRQDDIDRALKELDADGETNDGMLYYEYRIDVATLL